MLNLIAGIVAYGVLFFLVGVLFYLAVYVVVRAANSD